MAQNKLFAFWLALICVVVFAFQYYLPKLTDLFVLNSLAFTQVYRFITSIFLHGSLQHLAFNMFALILFGLILEKLIGSKRFLLVFFASGLLANIISVFFYPSSLGASGAIYGILGALTIIRPKMTVWAFSLPMPMFLAAILWIIAGVMGLFMPSNIGHIAHLSGIGVGFILGIIFISQIKRTKQQNNSIQLPERTIQVWENRYMK